MNPGKFKERIIIQTKERIQNVTGGNQTSWKDTKSVWASVKTLEPTPFQMAGQDMRRGMYEIWIRETAVVADQRLLWRDKVLEIDYVEEYLSGPPFYTILKCREARTI